MLVDITELCTFDDDLPQIYLLLHAKFGHWVHDLRAYLGHTCTAESSLVTKHKT